MDRRLDKTLRLYKDALDQAYRAERQQVEDKYGHRGSFSRREQKALKQAVDTVALGMLRKGIHPRDYIVWVFGAFRRQVENGNRSQQSEARKLIYVEEAFCKPTVALFAKKVDSRPAVRSSVARRQLARQARTLRLETAELQEEHPELSSEVIMAMALNSPETLASIFRFCVGVKHGLEGEVSAYKDEALLQYILDTKTYDEVWKDLIPKDWRKSWGTPVKGGS